MTKSRRAEALESVRLSRRYSRAVAHDLSDLGPTELTVERIDRLIYAWDTSIKLAHGAMTALQELQKGVPRVDRP